MQVLQSYLYISLQLMQVIIMLYVPIFIILYINGYRFLRQVGILGFICSLSIIIYATIFILPISFSPTYYMINLNPLDGIRHIVSLHQFMIEKFANIIMFIPLGFFLPILFTRLKHWYTTFLTCLILSVSIETLQYFIGRSCDINDIITNVLGGILGYFIYRLCHQLFYRYHWWLSLSQKEIESTKNTP